MTVVMCPDEITDIRDIQPPPSPLCVHASLIERPG